MYEYEVGQLLHKVTRSSYTKQPDQHESITVTKVGRKWASYGEGWRGGKFCILDSDEDYKEGSVYSGEYSSDETVYLSRQHYDDEESCKKAMADLYPRISRIPKKGVTLQNIQDAALLLKIELKD